MNDFMRNIELSKYNRYILNKIIPGFGADKDFNIYELVKESVSYKCILPSQNELVMETYYDIKEYLVLNEYVIERKEMTSYILTGKGIELKGCESIEKYEEQQMKQNKKSFWQTLFLRNKNTIKTSPSNNVLVEYYE
jgi:hypothetical protein